MNPWVPAHGGTCDPVLTRVIALPYWPVTCADVPAAGHLRPARRGSHAGTFGPPTDRDIGTPCDRPRLLLRHLSGVPIEGFCLAGIRQPTVRKVIAGLIADGAAITCITVGLEDGYSGRDLA